MSLKNNETKNLLFSHSSLLRTGSALPSGRGLSAGSGILGLLGRYKNECRRRIERG